MRERGKKKKRASGVEWRTSPGRVPLKIGSKLPIPALLARAKLCLSSPFQGTPGVLASIWCAQNALRCHLFKHSEPLANRDKPLFIKPLILAARMTTWLALKGALKSFIGMGGGNLYREGDSSPSQRELWRMNTEARWATVSSGGLMKGREWLAVLQEKKRKCVWLGTMGEKKTEWVRASMRLWSGGRDLGTRYSKSTSGWDHEQMWVRILRSSEGLSKWTNCWTNKWVMTVCLCRPRGCWCTWAHAGKWMSEAWWKRLSEWVMGVSDGCVDRKCQL